MIIFNECMVGVVYVGSLNSLEYEELQVIDHVR